MSQAPGQIEQHLTLYLLAHPPTTTTPTPRGSPETTMARDRAIDGDTETKGGPSAPPSYAALLDAAARQMEVLTGRLERGEATQQQAAMEVCRVSWSLREAAEAARLAESRPADELGSEMSSV